MHQVIELYWHCVGISRSAGHATTGNVDIVENKNLKSLILTF